MTIDEKAMRAAYDELRSRIVFLEKRAGLFVDDAELDKPRGTPKVAFDPRNWRGPSGKGKLASACEPEFLDAYAEALVWLAEHPKPGPDGKPDLKKAGYSRRDGMLCRSWARRLRAKAAAEAAAQKPDPDPFALDLPSDRFIVGRESADLFEDDDTRADARQQAERDTASPFDPATGEVFEEPNDGDFAQAPDPFADNPFDGDP